MTTRAGWILNGRVVRAGAAAVIATLACAAAPATAQIGGLVPGTVDNLAGTNQPPATTGRAPVPRKSEDEPGTLWSYLALIIIVGAAVGAQLIPSKRGHQD